MAKRVYIVFRESLDNADDPWVEAVWTDIKKVRALWRRLDQIEDSRCWYETHTIDGDPVTPSS